MCVVAYADAVSAPSGTGHLRVRTPAARTSAAGLGLLIAVLTGTALALIVAADLAVGGAGYHTWGVLAFAISFPVLPLTGWVLATKRPGNPLGWLFLGSALAMAAAAFAHGYGEYGVEAHPDSLPATDVVLALGGLGWLGFVVPAVFVPLLYPDGRLAGDAWRPFRAVSGAVLLVIVTATVLRPGPYEHFAIVDNPFGVAALSGAIEILDVLDAPVLIAIVAGSTASLLLRLRTAGAALRRQLVGLTAVVLALVSVEFVGSAALPGDLHGEAVICSWADGPTSSVLGAGPPMLIYVGLPLAVAVAVLRHNLYNLDRLVRRSAVYVALWLAIAAAYIAVAWLLGVAVTDQLPVGAAIGVTIVATLVIAPARRGLEGLADRWVFGPRTSGYELASDFGARIGPGTDLRAVAEQLAEITRRGLRVRWAAVTLSLDGDRAHAIAGESETDEAAELTVPVDGAGGRGGEIRCGPAPEPGRISANGRRLAELLARQAASALHTLALTRDLAGQVATVERQSAELAASRARIVGAAEAERRRIERDLHDGAQQELVAMMVKLRLALDATEAGTPTAAALRELHADAKAALVGVRELAQGIHPSVLSDAGLVSAVQARTARLPLPVEVCADSGIRQRRFVDAIEGGAFFVVCESLANVLKHARAHSAEVSLRMSGNDLLVSIRDDGVGFEPACVGGGGLLGLADRAAALGGALWVRSAPGEGTVVEAILPVDPPS